MIDILQRLVVIVKYLEIGRRHAELLHVFFGEYLAPLDSRKLFRGAEYPQALLLELVDDARDERRLGPDDRQVYLILLRELEKPFDVVGLDRDRLGDLRYSVGTRRAIEFRALRALGDLPRERVFPAACNLSAISSYYRDFPVPFEDTAYDMRPKPRRSEDRLSPVDIAPSEDKHHTDAHIERPVHLPVVDSALLLHGLEYAGRFP